jgi:hypothetical protein
MATGITTRHSRTCRSRGDDDGACNCDPGYEAWAWSARDERKIHRTFPTYAAARSWRASAKRQIDHGALRAPTATTLREAAEMWLAGADSGEVRNRSGDPYKPATVRGYRQALHDHVLPLLGSAKLSAITTSDLQVLVDRWQAEPTAASTIRNRIKPLQAIYRRAKSRGGLPVNPTQDLELPAPRPSEVEIVTPDEATKLLAALPVADRPLWGTALYAGLRYGELRALRWGDVDAAGGKIEGLRVLGSQGGTDRA